MMSVVMVGGLPGCRGEKGEEDNTLRFISNVALKTLDPQGTSWLVEFRIIEAAFEPLLRVDPATGELLPAVAEAVPAVADDGVTYTFTIRPDAKFSNGDPVTAHDFVYAWKRAMLPEYGADYAGLFFKIKGAEDFYNFRANQIKEYAKIAEKAGGGSIDAAEGAWAAAEDFFAKNVGLEAIDDHTLRVTMREPTAYALELFAFAPFSPVHQKERGRDRHAEPDHRAVAV